MKRAEYLRVPHVARFLDWAAPLVTGTRPLRHGWHSPKWGEWSCETLFEAFEAFDWPFRVCLPGASTTSSGRSYRDTVALLDELSQELRVSAEGNDGARFLAAAVAVVQWGQVRQNTAQLCTLGDQALPRLIQSARLLNPNEADLHRLSDVRPLNSGFSKIYSLLVDGFPIYDSRVACGIASLVRLFCEETGREEVPTQLAFGIPQNRGVVSRNPSSERLVFPRLWSTSARRYAESNVRAAWVLDALAAYPPFSELGKERQRALQSAMFMVGYKPLART